MVRASPIPVPGEARAPDAAPPPTNSGCATLLRWHRLAAGLTQAGLGAEAGLSARGIQNLERGIACPRRPTAERLARALRLTAEDRERFLVAARPRRRV